MYVSRQNLKFICAVTAVVLVTVAICISAVSCSGSKITFESCYYYVCYRITDNSVSAASLSGTVTSYGGAGYILNYDKDYYVTISCYYGESDAQSVCASLKKRDLDCSVLSVETDSYKLKNSYAKKNAELYKGNLNTLHSLSVIAYECANGLDTGEINQIKAKDILLNIESGLNSLLKANPDNCFTYNLSYLIALCEDKESGYLYSKDMRYLQIAITDPIINADLT